VDAVTVQEVLCKSALVKSGISDYALNPYTGCAHGCVYCYASFMARFSRHGLPWGQWVDVKVNIADVLTKELRGKRLRDAGTPPQVIMSSVTDPYQPLERTYKLTRACLEAIAAVCASRAPLNVSILTKSDLVLRDIDLLQRIPGIEVGMTVTTADDSVSRLYERGACPSSKRLAALRRLSDSGVRTWAFFGPVLPYHSDSEQVVQAILSLLQDAGVTKVLVDRFNPYPAAVNRFLRVAPTEVRQAFEEYRSRPEEYLARLRDVVLEIAAHLGVSVEVLF
jgi:DNA repair photolyase